MFEGMGKYFEGLQVCFFINEEIASKRVSQNRLFTTTVILWCHYYDMTFNQFVLTYLLTEAAGWRCSAKKIFLNILRSLQEQHPFWSLLLSKDAGWKDATLLKKEILDPGTRLFLWTLWHFQEQRFCRAFSTCCEHLPTNKTKNSSSWDIDWLKVLWKKWSRTV